MTPQQIEQVQSSFAKVAPISEQAAVIFYDRLFAQVPAIRAMFPQDMREQRKKLMATLAVVVGALPSVLPAASALARKHVGYGVTPEHYQVVGGGAPPDPGAGARQRLDAPARLRLDRGLHACVGLHDRRGLRRPGDGLSQGRKRP